METRLLCAVIASATFAANAYSTQRLRHVSDPPVAPPAVSASQGLRNKLESDFNKGHFGGTRLEADLEDELAGVISLSAQPPEDISLTPSSIEKMENAVTDLVTKSDTGTPMGDSVKKIKGLITDTMLPKVEKQHAANRKELNRLAKEVDNCKGTRNTDEKIADIQKLEYLNASPLHKQCRTREANMATEAIGCEKRISATKTIRDLKCNAADAYEKSWGQQSKNSQIVEKGAGETPKIYMKRLHDTYCSNGGSVYDKFAELEEGCKVATEKYKQLSDGCKNKMSDYKAKRKTCDNIQAQMDGAACNRAVLIKDACESYAECYNTRRVAFVRSKKVIAEAAKERKAEWRALKRMTCLIDSFRDGKVAKSEVAECKKITHSTDHLTMEFPELSEAESCAVPDRYPATAAYKKAEFAPLPALAKGNVDANECYGVLEISTKPRAGSPTSCKCQRVTMNGPFSAGALVKCENCFDVRRSKDRNSCPSGTKLFSPRSRTDWHTFLASASALRSPHFIVDVTKPQSGCKGCAASPMNNADQSSFSTWDGSPWWLRSTPYKEENANYEANCYMAVTGSMTSEDDIQFKSDSCNTHSSSYYCQQKWIPTTPKPGSPKGCTCTRVELTGRYSPGALLKCVGCTRVKASTDKDSCPEGTKLFSPRSREDWKTILDSAGPLRSPNWIVDVTRPEAGCGGCTADPMNFEIPSQATWRTQDGSPWWLRSTKYSEPNGDYEANCYMDLINNPNNPDSITFNDGSCKYSADSYYCQPRETMR